MRERHQLFFGLRLAGKKIPSFRNPNQNRGELWRIYSSNESAPANRKTGFYATRDPNKQEVGFNFAWSSSELWSCFRYSVLKFKNQKHIAVNVLLKGFPMVPLSCRSNLAGRYVYLLVESSRLVKLIVMLVSRSCSSICLHKSTYNI